MIILGISSFYHDSAACLLQNDNILTAVQEERFSRVKHDQNFPIQSILYCLNSNNLTPDKIDFVVFYEKPFLKFDRILETYLYFAPRGFKNFLASFPIWIKEKLFQKKMILDLLKTKICKKTNWKNKLLFSNHHLSHASSAFFPSPFKSAAILTMDGVGEWTTTSISIGCENKIKTLKEINFPNSLGLLYSSFTYYVGFKVNSGEYKLMGLAPYGRPKYKDLIYKNLIDIKDDGSYKLNLDYFSYCTDLKMTNNKFSDLFGNPPRKPETKINQFYMDIAASIQSVTEEIVIKLAKFAKKITNEDNLCISGGVGLNCVVNGVLEKKRIFKNIWIQPASGDSGGCLGAAFAILYQMQNYNRKVRKNLDNMNGCFLGPCFNDNLIKEDLDNLNAVYEIQSNNEIVETAAKFLKKGMSIGWMQGKMEFGPRSLGARSILANPMDKDMQKKLNLKIKFRESFRPFAPSVLEEDSNEWFDLNKVSPYMLLVGKVKKNKLLSKKNNNVSGFELLKIKRSLIPSVTHVDNTARIQTVNKTINPKFYNLLRKFKEITDCPILINTSFNIRGEPIVCSPKDAFKCFIGTDIDVLIIENFLLLKNKQTVKRIDYRSEFKLD